MACLRGHVWLTCSYGLFMRSCVTHMFSWFVYKVICDLHVLMACIWGHVWFTCSHDLYVRLCDLYTRPYVTLFSWLVYEVICDSHVLMTCIWGHVWLTYSRDLYTMSCDSLLSWLLYEVICDSLFLWLDVQTICCTPSWSNTHCLIILLIQCHSIIRKCLCSHKHYHEYLWSHS